MESENDNKSILLMLQQLNNTICKLNDKVDNIEKKISETHNEMNHHFSLIYEEIEMLKKRLNFICFLFWTK